MRERKPVSILFIYWQQSFVGLMLDLLMAAPFIFLLHSIAVVGYLFSKTLRMFRSWRKSNEEMYCASIGSVYMQSGRFGGTIQFSLFYLCA